MVLRKKTKPLIKRRTRLVPRGDRIDIVRLGYRRGWFADLYARFLSTPWIVLALVGMAIYILSNIAFAAIYSINPKDIENAHSFLDLFFFSVQTMATIGYGRMTPATDLANFVVTAEALWGFTYFAFVTGLVFAKFSRPTARVLFSDVAVISNYEGKPHLKIRLANQRTNRIVNAVVTLVLMRDQMTKEGVRMRVFYDLDVVRSRVPLLQLTWTLLHPINEKSPLYGVTQETLRENEDEIIISLSGHDETLSQTIYARHSYIADEIICGAFFKDVLTRRDDGTIQVDYNLFHSYEMKDDAKK